MKKIYLFLLLSCLSFGSFAQTAASYTFTALTGTYTDISGTGTIISGINGDDYTQASIPIGFNFVFCGTTYTQLAVSSNGFISFANSTTAPYNNSAATNMPSSGVGCLMPLFDDGDNNSGGGTPYYQTTGGTGSHIFIFEWKNWPGHGGTGFTGNVNYQVILYEGLNQIDFVYGATLSLNSLSATIGIANAVGDFLTLSDGVASPTVSSSTWYSGVTTYPANGQIYRWAFGCGGTPTAGSVSSSVSSGCSSYTSTLTLSGQTTLPGITTQWQSSPTGLAGSFVAIPGATNSTYAATMSTPGTNVYYNNLVTCTNSGLSATTGNVGLVYNVPPTPFTGTLNMCSGFTYPLSSSPTGGTWASSNTTVATVSGSGVVSAVGPGTSLITYTLLSGCSTSATITVNATPPLNAMTGGGSYCTGTTGVHVGVDGSTGGFSYQLYKDGTTTVGAALPGTGVPLDYGLILIPGVYTVIASNSSLTCTSTMLGSSTVVANPTPPVITGATAVCTGQNITLLNAASGGAWSSGNTGVATVSVGTGVVTGASAGTALITYTLPGGCFRTIIVTVNTAPAAIAGTPVACEGQTASLSSATFGGIWSSSNITLATVNTSGMVSALASGTANISYTLGNGCAVYVPFVVNPLPVAYSITGGNGYCQGGPGVHIGLSHSVSGVTYKLYNGGILVPPSVSGSNSALDFGLITTTGTYTSVALDPVTGCTNNMTGSTTVFTNPLPNLYSVSGGGNYCAGSGGGSVTLSGSDIGNIYQLYNGGVPSGIALPGTGSALVFTPITASGVYTVVATRLATGCTNTMSGNAVILVSPPPTVYTVTGGGSYCIGGAGQHVVLNGSDIYTNYQLYLDGTAVGSPALGINASIDFGAQTAAGTYSVIATNTITTCTGAMAGNPVIVINPLPPVHTIIGGGDYCAGTGGVHVGLDNSDPDISYQLINGSPTGLPVTGLGSSLDFGLQTAAGSYTAVATNSLTNCSSNMSGSAVIAVNSLPNSYAVNGGGGYCPGTSGVPVGLSGSESGFRYQLYAAGAGPVGAFIMGTGGSLNFGSFNTAGVYTVMATNTTTGCTNTMSGAATVTVNPVPAAYPVLASGTSYCAGDVGIDITLPGSENNISYQLYRGVSMIGAAQAGTGSPLDFGNQTLPAVYTIVGTNIITGCKGSMSGSAAVAINPLPVAYTVIGGGNYCDGGAGVHVGLSGSTVGVSYQLKNNGGVLGLPVAGTGAAIDFGYQTLSGTYTVSAGNDVTACTKEMAGSATVTINSQPGAYNVSAGGSYCAGGAGISVALSGSEGGVHYQLYNGPASVGSGRTGTGGALDFGLQTVAGTYTIRATNTSTGCNEVMTGSSVIVMNPVPVPYPVTGGGNSCSSGTGVGIGLSNSDNGISYQLYHAGAALGSAMPGSTGSAIDFGLQTLAGLYTVVATDTTTSCSGNMSGSAVVVVITSPKVDTMTGGGSYCVGGAGVAVGLNGSASGISYQLFNGPVPVGSVAAGTGSPLSFGLQTAAGSYTVVATNGGSCATTMEGIATVNANPLPGIYTITGGGNFCANDSAHVGLTGSGSGIKYQLYFDGSHIGDPLTGTSGALDFGVQTGSGVYSVIATDTASGCASNMGGGISVHIFPLPNAFTVTGGGHYCNGGAGVPVALTGSNTNVIYQLYHSGTVTGAPQHGSGTLLDFGLQTAAGNYWITGTDAYSLCTNIMTDTAQVGIDASLIPVVTISVTPTIIVKGQSATFTATATNAGSPSYQWFIAGVKIPGATDQKFVASNFSDKDSVRCEVTSNGACGGIMRSHAVAVTVVGNVGVQLVSQGGEVFLVPNPNKGTFTLKGTMSAAADEVASVEIADMVGHIVYRNNLLIEKGAINSTIQLSNIANGMYIVNLRSAAGNKVFHMVVEQ